MGWWYAGTHFSSSHCLSLLVFLCLVLACLVSKICLDDSSDMEDMKDLRLTVVLEDLVSLHVCAIGSDFYKIIKISEMQACITI